MHLCSESRRFAEGRLSFWEGQPLAGGPPVGLPCRPYRPATDAFFVSDFDAFCRQARKAGDARYHHEERRKTGGAAGPEKVVFSEHIVHLAIAAAEDPEYLVPDMTALRKLSLVFWRAGSRKKTTAQQQQRQQQQKLGGPGAETGTKRCTLVPFPNKKGSLRAGPRRRVVDVEDYVGGLEQDSSLWELSDKNKAAWNPYNGEWLFEFEAAELVRAPCNLYRIECRETMRTGWTGPHVTVVTSDEIVNISMKSVRVRVVVKDPWSTYA